MSSSMERLKREKRMAVLVRSRAGWLSWSCSQESGRECGRSGHSQLEFPLPVTCSLEGYKLLRWFCSLVNVFFPLASCCHRQRNSWQPDGAQACWTSCFLFFLAILWFCGQQVKLIQLHSQKLWFSLMKVFRWDSKASLCFRLQRAVFILMFNVLNKVCKHTVVCPP